MFVHEIWGATGTWRLSLRLTTVSKVESVVPPPAPKVTEKNSGFTVRSKRADSTRSPSLETLRGGKNSKLIDG